MVKAPLLLAFVAIAAFAPPALAASTHDGAPPPRTVTDRTDPAADDPLKLQWFSNAVDSFLSGHPEPEQPGAPAPAR